MNRKLHPETLLGPDDPKPVTVLNGDSRHPVVLVCEHAGRAVPAKLGALGLEPEALDRHIAWDIGTQALTRTLSRQLGAMAVLQNYSRLVIDCNRPIDASDSMPEISDHTVIPGNQGIADHERQARIDEIFLPFHEAVDHALDRTRCRAALAIHSFTPVMNGVTRPWDIGFLYRKDETTSHHLAASVARARPDLTIGLNQPYQISDLSDWFVPRHGERRRLPHSLIEVRNDHLADRDALDRWTGTLVRAVNALMETLRP
jgi:predicted N-formylglutamate amidohydrolase